MIPDTLLGLLLFAGSVGPGYVWVQVAERRRPREQRSAILEAAELSFVGILTTGIAAMLVLALGREWAGVNSEALLKGGTDYLAEHPARGIATLVSTLAVSFGLAYSAARLRYRESPVSVKPGFHAWDSALAVGVKDTSVHATAELRDGRRFSGWVHAFDVGTATNEQPSLVLYKPISVRARGGEPTKLKDVQFIALQGPDILYVTSNWFPPPVEEGAS